MELKTVQYHLHYCQPILDLQLAAWEERDAPMHAACMGTRLDLQPDLNCKCVYSGCVLVARGDGVHHHAVAKFHL